LPGILNHITGLIRRSYWHTCCQRQFPNGSQMSACRHDDVPIGGIVGGLIGAIDGAAIGQMRDGQIGGISIELLHSGCISPSTHWHVQDASTRAAIMSATQMLTHINACLIRTSPGLFTRPRCLDRAKKIPSRLTFVLYMFS
jgi:hypothetical protein